MFAGWHLLSVWGPKAPWQELRDSALRMAIRNRAKCRSELGEGFDSVDFADLDDAGLFSSSCLLLQVGLNLHQIEATAGESLSGLINVPHLFN